jgi:hypothetical protein
MRGTHFTHFAAQAAHLNPAFHQASKRLGKTKGHSRNQRRKSAIPIFSLEKP